MEELFEQCLVMVCRTVFGLLLFGCEEAFFVEGAFIWLDGLVRQTLVIAVSIFGLSEKYSFNGCSTFA